jgi:hypothetical protein
LRKAHEIGFLITRQSIARDTVATVAVAAAPTATAAWCVLSVFESATFGLRREQIRLHGTVVQTRARRHCRDFLGRRGFPIFAGRARLALTAFAGFLGLALRFWLALAGFFVLTPLSGFFGLAVFFGLSGLRCHALFLLVTSTATTPTTTTGPAAAFVAVVTFA